jgi:4-amino-4-deoxy-L-arabinose transferase-like glycosyltransferase
MAAALDNPDPSRPRDPAEAAFNTLVLAAIALAAVALHLAYATGYGYFRDELYYLACANHLSFGYVDRPPLSIWLLYLQRWLFGDSLFALRLLPAVYVGLLLTRERRQLASIWLWAGGVLALLMPNLV